MHFDLARAMREATELTRARRVVDATKVIQEALCGGARGDRTAPRAPHEDQRESLVLLQGPAKQEPGGGPAPADRTPLSAKFEPRLKWSIDELPKTVPHANFGGAAFGPLRGRAGRTAKIPEGAEFLTRSFTGPAGSRSYKLYLPAGRQTAGLPLIVMLHGCTQDPDDFAMGTRMNSLAEEFGFLVAYPCQPTTANPSSCWNWFEPKDQMRGRGEPSIIAGITEETVAKYDLDRGRIFVAGLSAGGAMAAVMGATYPDLYAAIGVHSGLAYGSARDVMSAFAAMRGETGLSRGSLDRPTAGPRAIIFHGDADHTVHSANGARIAGAPDIQRGEVAETVFGIAGGRRFTRTITRAPNGVNRNEHWLVAGAGHAWSGGSSEGSYTDAAGPDASREMVRFFFEG